MNMKIVTSTLAMLLSVAGLGVQSARAQESSPDPLSDTAPSESGAPADSSATASEPSADAPPAEPTSEPPAEEANPYDSAPPDYGAPPEESSPAPAPEPKGMRILWGVQLGYMFPTDPQPPFRAAKWMPIGAEIDFGLGQSPFAIVVKADVSPLCFGGDDCSGYQVRGLAGLEVGIQKAAESVLHIVYLNASLGYRYAESTISVKGGEDRTLNDNGMLVSEVSASMMLRVTRNFSLGPRVALSSNLTTDTPEGVSAVQLGLRVLHAPGR